MAFPNDEGYLTLATGRPHYVELALNLALSIKLKDRRPVALLCDPGVELPSAYRPFFDVVIEARPERLLAGLDTKLLLQGYSPFERTMFVDADCLMAKADVGRFWEALRKTPFSVVGDVIQRGPYCRFQDVAEPIARLGLPHMVRHNGGFMYFDQGATARRVFAQARTYYETQRDFLSYRHDDAAKGYNEEPLFAAAMALLALNPLPPRENVMYTARKGPYDIDVLRGSCTYGQDPAVSPTFVHFLRLEPREVYVREANRLRRWFDLPPWAPKGCEALAAAVPPVLEVPAKEDILPLLPKRAVVAEVGVGRGGFSRAILEKAEPARLHLIDPWTDDEETCRAVQERFAGPIAAGQVAVHRAPSLEAASELADGCLDWVFLDANHSYRGMRADLETYSPKVRPGGYVAGHDYVARRNYGVIQAVDEFVKSHAVHMVALTTDAFPSFVLRKRLPS